MSSLTLPSAEDIPSPCSNHEEDLDFDSTNDISSPSNAFIIDTRFDPTKKRNTEVEYNARNDEKGRYKYTKKERASAMKAIGCDSLSDLHKKVSHICCLIVFHSIMAISFG